MAMNFNNKIFIMPHPLVLMTNYLTDHFDHFFFFKFQVGLERYHGVGIIGFNSPEWFLSDLGAMFAG